MWRYGGEVNKPKDVFYTIQEQVEFQVGEGAMKRSRKGFYV